MELLNFSTYVKGSTHTKNSQIIRKKNLCVKRQMLSVTNNWLRGRTKIQADIMTYRLNRARPTNKISEQNYTQSQIVDPTSMCICVHSNLGMSSGAQ